MPAPRFDLTYEQRAMITEREALAKMLGVDHSTIIHLYEDSGMDWAEFYQWVVFKSIIQPLDKPLSVE
jgi:hypothetical protein